MQEDPETFYITPHYQDYAGDAGQPRAQSTSAELSGAA